MIKLNYKKLAATAAVLLSSASIVAAPAYALNSANKESTATSSSTTSSSSSSNSASHLQTIIQRGDTEITRRITSLNAVLAKLNATQKLSSADKTTLTTEVNTEISGLTALKTKLDADTDVTTAKADDQSIINDYRVYALLLPKIALVSAADAQQTAEAKLTALATKLQTRITAAQTAGKTVTDLQTKLTDMNTQIANASAISTSIEAKVVGLQPSDYNTDHTVLSGDQAQLETAESDIKTAFTDGKDIVSGLKNL